MKKFLSARQIVFIFVLILANGRPCVYFESLSPVCSALFPSTCTLLFLVYLLLFLVVLLCWLLCDHCRLYSKLPLGENEDSLNLESHSLVLVVISFCWIHFSWVNLRVIQTVWWDSQYWMRAAWCIFFLASMSVTKSFPDRSKEVGNLPHTSFWFFRCYTHFRGLLFWFWTPIEQLNTTDQTVKSVDFQTTVTRALSLCVFSTFS